MTTPRFIVPFLCFLISLFFVFPVEAEVFSLDAALTKDSANVIFRDNELEKNLEITYLGIFESPSPTDATHVTKEYRFQLKMRNFLGTVLAERRVSVFENAPRERDVKFSAYDPEDGKWQEFKDIQIVVKPVTTGTQAEITIAGSGRIIEPDIEPFASGASQLDDSLIIKIEAEYLPPVTPVILSSSVLKRVESTVTVTNIGNFQFEGTTDAAGKLTIEKEVRLREHLDNRNNNIYTLTASASHYFTFQNSAISEQRTTTSSLTKQVRISDFELKKRSSEFYTDRAYLTFNDNIKNVYDSKLLSTREKRGVAILQYGSTEKKYSNIPHFVVFLKDWDARTARYEISGGGTAETIQAALDISPEISFGKTSIVEINGQSIELREQADKARLVASSGVPKIAFYGAGDRFIQEFIGRDLRINFQEEIVIPHSVRVTSGGAVELSYAEQEKNLPLRWSAFVESVSRPGVQKPAIASGNAIYQSVPGASVRAIEPVGDVLRRQIIKLLRQLVILLQIQLQLSK